MREKILKTIKKYNMVNKGDNIVLGVSGGPDSMAMLNFFLTIRKEMNVKIVAVHINHKFREGTAERDEQFVKEYCSNNDVICYTKAFDVSKIAKEMKITDEEAGRYVRYSYYREVADKEDCNKIAVAHNSNDQVETFFMRLFRGTGIKGLRGIMPSSKNIIRPLIECSREEIEDYCEKENVEFVIDETNAKNIYSRNKIRNILLPYLKQNFDENILNDVNRLMDIIREEDNYVEEIINNIYENIVKENEVINIDKFNALRVFEKKKIIYKLLEAKEVSKDVGYKHMELILDFIAYRKTGKIMDLPNNVKLAVEYDEIKLRKELKNIEKFEYDYKSFIEIKELGLNIYTEEVVSKLAIDLDKVGELEKLKIRNRRDGDYIKLGGTRKLKSFFINNKVPREERDSKVLLAKGNEIILIIGEVISSEYGVDKSTKKPLTIKVR
ncbi:MAG: tRNA lysidine(34) synthetase TilS [Clostridia bacterium]|nr:tRNA lysidine(34) synthetase TilS [Clostridia bacterium]